MNSTKFLTAVTLFLVCGVAIRAQQPMEQRASINEPATAVSANGAAAIEGRLLTTVLNGAVDSPVTDARMVVKNVAAIFYTYVSGWATFYDGNGVRCGEGMFKVEALAPNESAEVDTPGLRLRCSPASWRIVANNLLTRTPETPKAVEAAPPAPPPEAVEKPIPTNFIISINGEEHPIQINNPIVLKLGNRNSKIVLRPVP